MVNIRTGQPIHEFGAPRKPRMQAVDLSVIFQILNIYYIIKEQKVYSFFIAHSRVTDSIFLVLIYKLD